MAALAAMDPNQLYTYIQTLKLALASEAEAQTIGDLLLICCPDEHRSQVGEVLKDEIGIGK